MKLFFDLDGVLRDLASYVNNNWCYNRVITNYGDRAFETFMEAMLENPGTLKTWLTKAPVYGKEWITKVSREIDYERWLITWVQNNLWKEYTEQFLKKHHLEKMFDKIIYTKTLQEKIEIIEKEKTGIVFDDRVETLYALEGDFYKIFIYGGLVNDLLYNIRHSINPVPYFKYIHDVPLELLHCIKEKDLCVNGK